MLILLEFPKYSSGGANAQFSKKKLEKKFYLINHWPNWEITGSAYRKYWGLWRKAITSRIYLWNFVYVGYDLGGQSNNLARSFARVSKSINLRKNISGFNSCYSTSVFLELNQNRPSVFNLERCHPLCRTRQTDFVFDRISHRDPLWLNLCRKNKIEIKIFKMITRLDIIANLFSKINVCRLIKELNMKSTVTAEQALPPRWNTVLITDGILKTSI